MAILTFHDVDGILRSMPFHAMCLPIGTPAGLAAKLLRAAGMRLFNRPIALCTYLSVFDPLLNVHLHDDGDAIKTMVLTVASNGVSCDAKHPGDRLIAKPLLTEGPDLIFLIVRHTALPS